jgi:hypothetical protein
MPSRDRLDARRIASQTRRARGCGRRGRWHDPDDHSAPPQFVGAHLDFAGLSAEAAELVAERYDAAHRGLLRPAGDRRVIGDTPIETTLEGLV